MIIFQMKNMDFKAFLISYLIFVNQQEAYPNEKQIVLFICI